MKFKTKEELKEEYYNTDKYGYQSRDSEFADIVLELAFKSFAERVKFYKKYDDVPFQLKEDNYNLWLEFGNSGMMFEDWLFDYCFKDI